jgi:hypothetical protein
MGHGHHAGGVNRVQRADEVEDARETVLVDRDLRRGEIEARQDGDARDLLAGKGHRSFAMRVED